MNSKYKRSYVEVIEILKLIPREEILKIPTPKIEYYKKYMDKKYIYVYNNKNISKEAKAILINLYKNYIATEEEKVLVEQILELNYIKKSKK